MRNHKRMPHPCLLGDPKRAEILRQPSILGGPQRQARGAKSEVASSPVPSRGPKSGGKCYVTPPFLGVPNAKRGEQNETGYLTPAFSGAQKRAKMLSKPCILGGPRRQARGAKSQVVPNNGEQNQNWLHHPCLLGGPKECGNATSHLHSRGSPTPSVGSKIRNGPQQRGTKSEVAASPLPSRGPKREQKYHANPAFSGVPNAKRGDQNQKWLPHPCLLGPKRGRKCYVTPTFSGVPNVKHGEQNQKWSPTKGNKIRSGPQQRGTKSEVATSPLPSVGSKRGRKCYVTPTFSGVPNVKHGEQNQKWSPTKGNKIRSGPQQRGTKSEVATSPLPSRAQKRAEMLRHPYILRGPQRQARGAKSEVVPNKGEQNQKWSPTKGNKIRSGYLTLAFCGVQKRA